MTDQPTPDTDPPAIDSDAEPVDMDLLNRGSGTTKPKGPEADIRREDVLHGGSPEPADEGEA